MKKKVFCFAIIALALVAPVFATEAVKETEAASLNLGFIQRAVNLIVGVFAGGYVLLKAALDIFHAVRNSSEDQNALKKAIGGLVLNVAILAGFMFIIRTVFKQIGDGKAVEGQAGFFNAISELSGAEVAPIFAL